MICLSSARSHTLQRFCFMRALRLARVECDRLWNETTKNQKRIVAFRPRGHNSDGFVVSKNNKTAYLCFFQSTMSCMSKNTLQGVADRVESAAICIGQFVSSLESASRDTCRNLQRPSSITEPRYPSLGVVKRGGCCDVSFGCGRDATSICVSEEPTEIKAPKMILLQVHLQQPCYDFCLF